MTASDSCALCFRRRWRWLRELRSGCSGRRNPAQVHRVLCRCGAPASGSRRCLLDNYQDGLSRRRRLILVCLALAVLPVLLRGPCIGSACVVVSLRLSGAHAHTLNHRGPHLCGRQGHCRLRAAPAANTSKARSPTRALPGPLDVARLRSCARAATELVCEELG